MQPGKILVADHQGAFAIKLVGDVRLTYCTALDEFCEKMFEAPDFHQVVVDLSAAENVDSTTLGQLARLAITARERCQQTPVAISTNPNISRVLDCMGLDRVFDIHREPQRQQCLDDELAPVAECESGVRDRVLGAHRTLMGLSEENRVQFQELVCALESL